MGLHCAFCNKRRSSALIQFVLGTHQLHHQRESIKKNENQLSRVLKVKLWRKTIVSFNLKGSNLRFGFDRSGITYENNTKVFSLLFLFFFVNDLKSLSLRICLFKRTL